MIAEDPQDPAADASGEAEKVDPETLELRGRPAGVVRFRRGLIVGVAGCAGATLAAIAWFALDPPRLTGARVEESDRPGGARPADALAALPDSYGDVPQLGPPLPGDLGRPILAQARKDGSITAVEDGNVAAEKASRRAREARERVEELRRAARASAVLAQSVSGKREPATVRPGAQNPDQPNMADSLELPGDAARRPGTTVGGAGPSVHRLEKAASPYVLAAGSVIPASLITGVNSDLPGLITAQVTERVYDSATGQILLIPQGARLLGTYDSVVAYGQRRALIVWQRLILPDGSSLTIDNVPATDASGYAGLADGVDFHTWALLKGVALSTLLGVGANLSIGGESDLVRALRESIQQGGSRAGEQIVAKGLDIKPTIKIRPGANVRLLVNRDMVLRPWLG